MSTTTTLLGPSALALFLPPAIVAAAPPERPRAAGAALQTTNAQELDPATDEFPLDTVITWSDPPDGFVDTRQDLDETGAPDGVTTVYVQFDRPVPLRWEMLEVIGTADELPVVNSLTWDGASWVVELDRPMPTGELTGIAFGGGVEVLVFTAHPGDMDQDGVTDEADQEHLAAAVENGAIDVLRYDFNRDGVLDPLDVDRLEAALASSEIGGEWPEELGLRDGGQCCCGPLGGCYLIALGSECGGTPLQCPCRPTSCN